MKRIKENTYLSNFPQVAFSTWLICLFLCFGCGSSKKKEISTFDFQPRQVAKDSVEGKFGLSSEIMSLARPNPHFEFPVGKGEGAFYRKARGLVPGIHFGEDWNGINGGDTDFGDLVTSVADGVVFYSKDFRPGWGKVVRILHNYGTDENPQYVESLYAHLATSWVKEGVFLRMGDPVGTVGSADGVYHAHLHFEMRTEPNMPISWREGGDTLKFLNPSLFIKNHLPPIRVKKAVEPKSKPTKDLK